MFVIFLLSFVNLDAKKRIIDNTIYDMYKPSLEKYDNSKIYIFSKTHQEHIISATGCSQIALYLEWVTKISDYYVQKTNI